MPKHNAMSLLTLKRKGDFKKRFDFLPLAPNQNPYWEASKSG